MHTLFPYSAYLGTALAHSSASVQLRYVDDSIISQSSRLKRVLIYSQTITCLSIYASKIKRTLFRSGHFHGQYDEKSCKNGQVMKGVRGNSATQGGRRRDRKSVNLLNKSSTIFHAPNNENTWPGHTSFRTHWTLDKHSSLTKCYKNNNFFSPSYT